MEPNFIEVIHSQALLGRQFFCSSSMAWKSVFAFNLSLTANEPEFVDLCIKFFILNKPRQLLLLKMHNTHQSFWPFSQVSVKNGAAVGHFKEKKQ